MSAHEHDSNKARKTRLASIQRTLDAYEGKQALLATWENCDNIDPDYLRELKHRTDKKRNELKFKSAI